MPNKLEFYRSDTSCTKNNLFQWIVQLEYNRIPYFAYLGSWMKESFLNKNLQI